MAFRGRFRPARHMDHAMPPVPPRALLGSEGPVDVRIWRRETGDTLLLANAGRKTGMAVQRNRFRRRVRMALFQILGEAPLSGPCVIWVRPSRRAPQGCRVSFDLLLGQLRLALSRFQARQA